MLETIKQKALEGIPSTVDEALELNLRYTADELADAGGAAQKTANGVPSHATTPQA